MNGASSQTSSRPSSFEERYRLYLDESGDHVFNFLEKPSHRFLCLLGCWFRNPEYMDFHARVEDFKRAHLPHHPDDPPILHREDIINRRGYLSRRRRSHPGSCPSSNRNTTTTSTAVKLKVMVKCFSPNEKAPQRGFLTLAHAGDPTPVIWIARNLSQRFVAMQCICNHLKTT